MITVNAIGDACPIPVVKTLNAIKELKGADVIETLVDNEIAVQNLIRMADKKGCPVKSEKISDKEFKVIIEVGEAALAAPIDTDNVVCELPKSGKKNTVVVISSKAMGHGGDELGTALMKGFIFALSQQEQLPTTILFYNGGANIPVEGSVSLEDLKNMEAQGVEILTCGTCLNFYGLTDKLAVGEVTNMYTIVEKMTGADLIVKP
ncbi:MAG: sulfurtransferase-like selenium metabolism protein YedF [Oscillospiraceae bacterium]|nr:sulfurtransferase-like selenium metabolism protein YedF [Oscillospiraceae bacterium]